MVSLVVIGLLLGTLFIIDLVLMCSRKGFMYGLVTKCSERKGNKDCISKFCLNNTVGCSQYKLVAVKVMESFCQQRILNQQCFFP